MLIQFLRLPPYVPMFEIKNWHLATVCAGRAFIFVNDEMCELTQ